MMAIAKIILRIGLSLTVLFIIARCTEEYVDVNSVGTSIKLLENGRNLMYAPLNFSKNSDGTYQYYYNDDEDEPFLSRTRLDANGNFILKTQPENAIRSESTNIDLIGPQVLEIAGPQILFDTVSWSANKHFNVELRFGPGKKQKAHRFVVPYGSTVDNFYYYLDYVDVPFEAWDVATGRQLMVSFRDQGNDTEFNLVPYDVTGPATSQSREYIVIHDVSYDPSYPLFNYVYDPFRSYSEAFFIWLYLREGVVWDPASLQPASVKIYHKSESRTLDYRPINPVYGGATNIYVQSDNNDCILYSYLNSGSSLENVYQLSTIAIFDKNWNFKASKIINSFAVDGGTFVNGALHAKDGGVLLSSTTYDSHIDFYQVKIKFTKLNRDLTTAYEHSFYEYDFYKRFGVNSGSLKFIEKGGRDFFLFDDVYQGRILFEIKASGITRLGKPTFPGLNSIVSVIAVGDKFAVLSNNGIVYLFDERLSAPQVITLPSLVVQELNNVYRAYSIYSVDGTLYFTAFLDDQFNQITRQPKFIVGRIEQSGTVNFKSHELGSNIRSAASIFSGDGTGVHLVQVQSSTQVTDLLLFKTNELFEIK